MLYEIVNGYWMQKIRDLCLMCLQVVEVGALDVNSNKT